MSAWPSISWIGTLEHLPPHAGSCACRPRPRRGRPHHEESQWRQVDDRRSPSWCRAAVAGMFGAAPEGHRSRKTADCVSMRQGPKRSANRPADCCHRTVVSSSRCCETATSRRPRARLGPCRITVRTGPKVSERRHRMRQFIFPASRVCTDPRWGPPTRFHLHESVVQKTVA